MGPTPPGTGVMAETISLTPSKSTSPQSLPSSPRFMPTSTMTAPGLTMSRVMSLALPMAGIRKSASRVTAPRSGVREWHTVTVALPKGVWAASSMAMGLPTMLLRPTTTAFLPAGDRP